MEYENPWMYNDSIFTSSHIDKFYGFVYLITNLTSQRKYIGKKFFYFSKTYQKNKKKRRKKVESDWISYYGSSEELKKDVNNLGKGNFSREILFLGETKGQCNYIEAKLQFENDVLLKEDYYNGWIQVKTHHSHVKGLMEA